MYRLSYTKVTRSTGSGESWQAMMVTITPIKPMCRLTFTEGKIQEKMKNSEQLFLKNHPLNGEYERL